MLPETGGYFVFSRRAFGDAVGFTVGWTDWIGQTSAIAYASIAFGEFLGAAGARRWRAAKRMIGVAIILPSELCNGAASGPAAGSSRPPA